MAEVRPAGDALREVTFRCVACAHQWKRAPEQIVDAPDDEFHPFAYFAECPVCGEEAPQAYWERNLLRAWASATGPRTPEGKAVVAANLAGHPTPEEARRTRFNAVKHGLYARTATFFPAKPGRYPQCEGCEHLATEACRPHGACLKRSELFLQFQIAFEQRDPRLLQQLHADNQAAIQALIMDMITTIAADGGPELTSQEWYYDREGGLHWVERTNEETGQLERMLKKEAHPLLKPLIEFIHKAGLTMEDLAMTPKAQDESDLLRGYLDAERDDRQRADEHREKTRREMDTLRKLLGVREPALIEGTSE
jgi:hypothetical protein